MSQETTNPTHSPQNQKGKNNWIYIGVILLLLIACVFLWINRNKVSDERDHAVSEMNNVVNSKDRLEDEYNAAISRLDLLVTKNAELDSMVSSKNSEVNKLKKEIQSILNNSRATAADLEKARTLINTLNAKVKGYEERIAELEAENTTLAESNTLLTKERDSTVTDNIALAQKVRLGAVLHASNIRMQPIDLRRGGRKEKETGRASRVDVLRITFDLDENRIIESGVKDLYLRIIGPEGNLLSNAAYGSGVANTYDGQPFNYTMAKQINLEQNTPVKNVVADWHQDSEYKKGEYKIEIYHDGYRIGSGSVNLK